jgi:unsaturated chondroitin disaccharide hydrolase
MTDHSTWARAQAWGILGWTLTYLWSGDTQFRDAGERAADWWLAHAPANRVAFWDFDDPKIPNTFRDTSATAIVAASLLTLAPRASTAERARAYRAAAEATTTALVERHLRADGRLTDGCYSPRIDLATRHELIWGSYFLFEALHNLAGLYDPAKLV